MKKLGTFERWSFSSVEEVASAIKSEQFSFVREDTYSEAEYPLIPVTQSEVDEDEYVLPEGCEESKYGLYFHSEEDDFANIVFPIEDYQVHEIIGIKRI